MEKIVHQIDSGDEYVMEFSDKKDFSKVMLAIPAIQDPLWQFVMASNSIAYPPNFTKTTQITWGREVGDARNHIVESAINANVEYLFFLDDDVLPPPNIFVKMLSYHKDIVSALYCTKSKPAYPLVFTESGAGCYTDWELGEIVKVWGCGLGATLIDMKVFTEDKIEKPYFKSTKLEAVKDPQTLEWFYKTGTEDLYFYDKVEKAGYDVYVDTSIQCMHFDRRSNMQFPIDGFEKWYEAKEYIT